MMAPDEFRGGEADRSFTLGDLVHAIAASIAACALGYGVTLLLAVLVFT